MSPALGFGHDGVDASQLDQIFGGNPHSLGSEVALFGVAPHDRGAGFRGDHGINGVLHHEDAVRDRYGQRPARSTFAGDGSDDRHLESRHFTQVVGNGFGLAALFCPHAGVGPGHIDQ